MTALATALLPAPRAAAPLPPLSLGRPFAADPTLAALGIGLALSLALTVPAAILDPRLFQAENVWVKPIKFQAALSIYFLSLAFFARWLPAGFLARPALRVFGGVVVIATLGEILWIAGAAMFGTASHYNVATPAMESLYLLMGVFAVTLTAASLVYGIAILRNRDSGLPPALHLSIGLGLILTFALTVPAAGTLSAMPGHHVGTPILDARVPVMGWSREVGDLRIAHFLATHALHALPLVGLAVARLERGRQIVWAAAAAYAALTAATLVQALAGLPLIPLG